MDPGWDGVSDCDAENGKRQGSSGNAGQDLKGLFRVKPSGIPNVSPNPVEIKLEMDPYLCTYISTHNADEEDRESGVGILKINGVLTTYVTRYPAKLQNLCSHLFQSSLMLV